MLSGDVPLVTGADLEAVIEARRADGAAIALASVYAADPAALGRVVRGDFGTVERIVEARDATPEELEGNEINVGLYAFDAAWLRRRIATLEPSAATGELYLTDLVAAGPRGRPDRRRGRLRGRRPASTASTTGTSWRRPSGTCGCGSTRPTCAPA